MPFNDAPALRQTTVLECTWSDIPDAVRDDVRRLWQDYDYGNDDYYYRYDRSDVKGDDWQDDDWIESYPKLFEYLEAHKVEKCLIHFWW